MPETREDLNGRDSLVRAKDRNQSSRSPIRHLHQLEVLTERARRVLENEREPSSKQQRSQALAFNSLAPHIEFECRSLAQRCYLYQSVVIEFEDELKTICSLILLFYMMEATPKSIPLCLFGGVFKNSISLPNDY